MKFLYTLALCVFLAPIFSQAVQEDTFEGLFYKSSGKYYFEDVDSRKLLNLVPSDHFVEQDLARLDSGDVLIGSGYIDNETNTLYFSAVHFVGLAKMLGIWRGDSNTIFEFLDFNQFKIYETKFNTTHHDSSRYLPVKSYQYSVAPNAKEAWSILINDDKTIKTGRLQVTHSKISIDLIDPGSGKIEKTIILRRAF